MIDSSLIDSLGFLCKEDTSVPTLLEWEDMWISLLVSHLFGNIKTFPSHCAYDAIFIQTTSCLNYGKTVGPENAWVNKLHSDKGEVIIWRERNKDIG